ncbi:hypothetical protein ABT224_37790 [Streptomyces sp. NPDC001584]|uniref:hypothetical protein n=1 Tax=Streptomyces sp. NPDC001584 TaxID=3154521 RepID=UPI00331DBC5D
MPSLPKPSWRAPWRMWLQPAHTRTGGWETHRLARGEPALVCFITVSGVDQLLRSPLQEVF